MSDQPDQRSQTERLAGAAVPWVTLVLLTMVVFLSWQVSKLNDRSNQLSEQLAQRDAVLDEMSVSVDTFARSIQAIDEAIAAVKTTTIGSDTRTQLDAALPLVFDIYAVLCATHDVADRPANCPAQATP